MLYQAHRWLWESWDRFPAVDVECFPDLSQYVREQAEKEFAQPTGRLQVRLHKRALEDSHCSTPRPLETTYSRIPLDVMLCWSRPPEIRYDVTSPFRRAFTLSHRPPIHRALQLPFEAFRVSKSADPSCLLPCCLGLVSGA
ncbi:hypothetical protein VTK56DRAFT_799 [Thermocarpiscus australiensis]